VAPERGPPARKQKATLRQFGIIQIIVGALSGVGAVAATTVGPQMTVTIIVAVVLGILVVLSGVLGMYLSSRFPAITQYGGLAMALFVAIAVVGTAGAIAIALFTPPLVLGIMIGVTQWIVTFIVCILANTNRRIVGEVKGALAKS
jgi:hypothetical protein